MNKVCDARRKRARGVASTEAVIALPFLLLVFVAVIYVRSSAREGRDVAAHARYCAWSYSSNNCDAVPPGCEGLVQVTEGGDVADAAAEQLADGMALVTDATPAIGGVVERVLRPVVLAAFGRSALAEVSRDLARPELLGGGQGRVRGDYHLACNLRALELEGAAREAWEIVVP